MEGMSIAFLKVADLALALGVESIKDLPGLWEHQVDEHWKIRVNGHDKIVENILPTHCLVEYNDMPAGMIHPYGGEFIFSDTINEDAFIKALEKAIQAAKQKK